MYIVHRSMTVNAVMFGTPFWALKGADQFAQAFLGTPLLGVVAGPYLMTLIPRLVMLSLSFVVDWCVYQICVLYKHSFNQVSTQNQQY